MIREIFLEDMSLWVCVWQSTLFAVIGLVGSLLLRRRPARASQVLFLAMIAAVLVPTMSVLVARYELGLFATKPIAITQETPSNTITPDYETSVTGLSTEVQHEFQKGAGELTSARVDSGYANIPWRKVVMYGWMTATLILAGRLLIAFVGGIFLMRRAQSNGSEQIRRATDSARAKLGITKDLQVRSSRDVHCPVIWCWSPAPILLVPDDLAHRIDWVGVICHELAHWSRRDHISGLIAELVVCILSWNPLLWWSKKRMVKFSEQACDDWVLAGGQPCEDYAQSLLNFRPRKQAAFVLAVVSSKKTLTGRVRRILKDRRGNPRIGVAWALTASLVVLCLSIGIAFAQTRPSKPTGTIKSKLSHSAVIEQPASTTMMIKGQILDPNDEPASGARIVALPVTSWGYETGRRNKEGYFELPWSPTWIEEGQSIYLMAIIQDPKSEAALVEVTDPTQPVIIRLKPAFTLTGKVVDPSGQQIEECLTAISLSSEFKCKAPIFWARGGQPWERRLSPLPYGTKYTMTIQAEGYQTKQLIVDGTDKNQKVIDLGTITLQPQDPTKLADAEQRPNSYLAKEFHDIYRLDEGEVIKLIKPPFVLGRQEYFQNPTSFYGPIFLSLENPGAFQVNLIWDGEQLKKPDSGYTSTHRPRTLEFILHLTLRMLYDEFNLPKELDIKMPYGDWIVRLDSPRDERLRALEEIIYAETNRAIRFEKRSVGERDTIIVTGRYSFKPLSEEYEDKLFVSVDEKARLRDWEKDSLSELFHTLSQGLNIPIDDRSEPVELDKIRYAYDHDLLQPFRESWPKNREEKLEKELPILLDNLAKQTGLQFTVESQPAEMWFVAETKEN